MESESEAGVSLAKRVNGEMLSSFVSEHRGWLLFPNRVLLD